MKVVASEKISDKLELVVVKPDSKDGNPPSERDCELEEKLGIELYGNFPRIAKYNGRYLHIDVWGCDMEDDSDSAISTLKVEADWHRANPAMIGNTLISTIQETYEKF